MLPLWLLASLHTPLLLVCSPAAVTQVQKHNAQSSEKGLLVKDKAQAVKQVLFQVPREAQQLLVDTTVARGWENSPWSDDCLASKRWCPGAQSPVCIGIIAPVNGKPPQLLLLQVQKFRRQGLEDSGQGYRRELPASGVLFCSPSPYPHMWLKVARCSMWSTRTKGGQSGFANNGNLLQKRQHCAAP